MAAATTFMGPDLLVTPGFFSAAMPGGEEPNVFESSFRASASGADAADASEAKPSAPAFDLLRGAAADNLSPLFGLSPGLSPLPYGTDTAATSRDTVDEARARVWNGVKGALQVSTSLPAAAMSTQEPSPPHSSTSPPQQRFQPSQQQSLMRPGFAGDFGDTGPRQVQGSLTPPDDSDIAILEMATDAPVAASGSVPEMPPPTAPKRKRGRQQATQDDSEAAPVGKRRRRTSVKAKAASNESDDTAIAVGDEGLKRSRFLERNRVAASKCRTKKKEWTSNLEARARELQAEKNQLALIVGSLRDEVVWLKGELLKHTSCGCEKIREYLDHEIASIAGTRAAGQLLKRQGGRRAAESAAEQRCLVTRGRRRRITVDWLSGSFPGGQEREGPPALRDAVGRDRPMKRDEKRCRSARHTRLCLTKQRIGGKQKAASRRATDGKAYTRTTPRDHLHPFFKKYDDTATG